MTMVELLTKELQKEEKYESRATKIEEKYVSIIIAANI